MNADMSQYLSVFLDEAIEQVALLESEVLKMEAGDTSSEILQSMFRAAHTVKGSSRAMGLGVIGALTHELENVLDALRHDQIVVTPAIVNILLEGIDALKSLIDSVANDGTDEMPLGDLVARIAALAPNADNVTATPPVAATPLLNESEAGSHIYDIAIELDPTCIMRMVRILMVLGSLEPLGRLVESTPSEEELSDENLLDPFTAVFASTASTEELERAINLVSEISSVEVTCREAEEQADPTPVLAVVTSETIAPTAEVKAPRSNENQTIRVGLARLDSLLNLVGELVIDRTQIERIVSDLKQDSDSDERFALLTESMSRVSRITSELQDEVMKTRMLPIDGVFQRLPRMVRDLAQKTGKEIQFAMAGGETELDRSVLEILGDPLIHLLRNSIDHGVEGPEERLAKGKPREGKVTIDARYEESHIVIDVSDDGRGIDPVKIREAAIRKGLISSSAAAMLSERESLELIMASGFSTAESLSDISGRGVGMDIVKTNIERVGGRVLVDSSLGNGTRFRIHLPLTLAIMRALLVSSQGQTLVLPLGSIHEILSLRRDESSVVRATVSGLAVVVVRGQTLPLASLWDLLLGRPAATSPTHIPDEALVMVVGHGDRRVGICVDAVIGEQEVVLKPLGALVGQVSGVTGASILGDGCVALIVDVASAVDAIRGSVVGEVLCA